VRGIEHTGEWIFRRPRYIDHGRLKLVGVILMIFPAGQRAEWAGRRRVLNLSIFRTS